MQSVHTTGNLLPVCWAHGELCRREIREKQRPLCENRWETGEKGVPCGACGFAAAL